MSDTENTTQETSNKEDLPQWARDQITKANDQAAKYRVEKNDAVEAAKAEVEKDYTARIEELQAKFNESQEAVNSERHEVDKLKAAIEAGIANDKVLDFADLLKGDNPEELKSHADKLKSLFTTDNEHKSEKQDATDPTQGQGNSLPLNGDPLLNALKSKLNIR